MIVVAAAALAAVAVGRFTGVRGSVVVVAVLVIWSVVERERHVAENGQPPEVWLVSTIIGIGLVVILMGVGAASHDLPRPRWSHRRRSARRR